MVGGLLPRRIVLQLQKANKLNCLLMLCPSQLNSLICAAKVLNQARKKLRHHSVAVQMLIFFIALAGFHTNDLQQSLLEKGEVAS
ncbi:unnamed protein product [Lactuca virosa]|uniref:Uncharacterized protein n=1 Tax=Lactuca virosa TaxID=75947 RepID=A0AAU9PM82_9ASTR|nr:unnamed protein product [Lactuca virosa]